MPKIRVRYHYGFVVMDEHGVLENTKALCGATVEVLSKYGEPIRLPYLGVRNLDRGGLLPVQYVKLKGISKYFPDNDILFSKGIELALDHYCVGVYDCGGVFLVLENERPISYPIEKKHYLPKNLRPRSQVCPIKPSSF